MSAIESLLARLPELQECAPPVVVGCSGGPDSLALLALASAAGCSPIVVHVDHGLRADSAADADVVARAADRFGARFRAVRVEVAAGSNLEARARATRYDALETTRRRLGASAVLVGHTMDDQAETVVLNLLRGSAGSGLGGMAPRTGTLVRPLLGLRRSETEAICAELDLEPVRDPMNEDPAFRRVWIRTDVLPRLAAGAQRDLVPVLARQAELLRTESAFLDDLAAAAWPNTTARARDLVVLDPVLARRAVRCWLGSPPPRAAEVDTILAIARGERRAVELAGGRRVWRTAGMMRHQSQRAVADYGVGA